MMFLYAVAIIVLTWQCYTEGGTLTARATPGRRWFVDNRAAVFRLLL